MALVIVVLVLILTTAAAAAAEPSPDAQDARELVRDSHWGVASNLDFERNNTPFGNAVSYADGGTGVPYMYLTPLDKATARFAAVDDRTSLALSKYALGTCGDFDPQEPTCVKVTLLGKLQKLSPESEEGVFASQVLFKQHPRFSRVPAIAKFELYKLDISAVVVINSYVGSPKTLQLEDYFSV